MRATSTQALQGEAFPEGRKEVLKLSSDVAPQLGPGIWGPLLIKGKSPFLMSSHI